MENDSREFPVGFSGESFSFPVRSEMISSEFGIGNLFLEQSAGNCQIERSSDLYVFPVR